MIYCVRILALMFQVSSHLASFGHPMATKNCWDQCAQLWSPYSVEDLNGQLPLHGLQLAKATRIPPRSRRSNDLWTLTEGEVFAPHSILHMLSRYRAVPCSYPSQHHWVEESETRFQKHVSRSRLRCSGILMVLARTPCHRHRALNCRRPRLTWCSFPHTRSTPMGKSQGLSVTRCCAHAFKSKLSHKRHKHSHRTSINVVYLTCKIKYLDKCKENKNDYQIRNQLSWPAKVRSCRDHWSQAHGGVWLT